MEKNIDLQNHILLVSSFFYYQAKHCISTIPMQYCVFPGYCIVWLATHLNCDVFYRKQTYLGKKSKLSWLLTMKVHFDRAEAELLF